MDRVLQRVLRSFIQRGTLRLTTARGTTWEFGDGSGKPVVVRFTTPAAERQSPRAVLPFAALVSTPFRHALWMIASVSAIDLSVRRHQRTPLRC